MKHLLKLILLFCCFTCCHAVAQQADSCRHPLPTFNTYLLERSLSHNIQTACTSSLLSQQSFADLMTRKTFEDKGIFAPAKQTQHIRYFLPVTNDSTAVKDIYFPKDPHADIPY